MEKETTRAVVVVPIFAPIITGMAWAEVIRPLCAMTTIRPAVTELDWNMLVMIKPITIAAKMLSVMDKRESTSAFPCNGDTIEEIRFRL